MFWKGLEFRTRITKFILISTYYHICFKQNAFNKTFSTRRCLFLFFQQIFYVVFWCAFLSSAISSDFFIFGNFVFGQSSLFENSKKFRFRMVVCIHKIFHFTITTAAKIANTVANTKAVFILNWFKNLILLARLLLHSTNWWFW